MKLQKIMLACLGIFVFLLPLVFAISDVKYSVDDTVVSMSYKGTPPFKINIRSDEKIGGDGGFVWATTDDTSFSYDFGSAVNPGDAFYFGVKDFEWSEENVFCESGGAFDGEECTELDCFTDSDCFDNDDKTLDSCVNNECTHEVVIFDATMDISTEKDVYSLNEPIMLTGSPEYEQSVLGASTNKITGMATYVSGSEKRVDTSNKPRKYIVVLETEPLIVKSNEIQIRSISSRRKNRELVSYGRQVDSLHNSVSNTLVKKHDVTEKTIKKYKNSISAMSLELKPDEVAGVEKLSGVKGVYPDVEVRAVLMDSVGMINADDVWLLDSDGNACLDSGNECLTGEGMTIGIIDTGVDYTHSDLGGCFGEGCKVVGGYDFVNNDDDPMDDMGHGTHCAATAAGKGVLTGVAPDAKIYAYKVLDSWGGGYSSDIIAGIERSLDPNQDGDFSDMLDVISLSLGGWGNPDDPMSMAIDNVVNAGVVAVIAAGNSGPWPESIGSPGTARNAITVGAVDKESNIADFSSRGPVVWKDESGNIKSLVKPDVVAPGVNICAAQWEESFLDYGAQQCVDDDHVAISGTSMATPHVAGAVALLKQKNPDWTPAEIKSVLRGTTTSIGEDVVVQGQGLIDVLSSVELENKPRIALFGGIDYAPAGDLDIFGTAKGEDFQSYGVLYFDEGIGEWISVCYDTQEVDGGVLCAEMSTQNFADGIYKLKLIVYGVEDTDVDYGIFEVDNLNILSPGNNDIFRAGDILDVNLENLNSEIVFDSIKFINLETGIVSSEGMLIHDNSFATWDTSSLESGFYDLTLSFEFSGSYFEETISEIYLDATLKEGWPQKIAWDIYDESGSSDLKTTSEYYTLIPRGDKDRQNKAVTVTKSEFLQMSKTGLVGASAVYGWGGTF